METQQLLEEYAALPDEARRQVADFVAFLRQRYNTAPSTQSSRADSENEGFVGMWRERDDMQDGAAWVREARQSQWSRK